MLLHSYIVCELWTANDKSRGTFRNQTEEKSVSFLTLNAIIRDPDDISWFNPHSSPLAFQCSPVVFTEGQTTKALVHGHRVGEKWVCLASRQKEKNHHVNKEHVPCVSLSVKLSQLVGSFESGFFFCFHVGLARQAKSPHSAITGDLSHYINNASNWNREKNVGGGGIYGIKWNDFRFFYPYSLEQVSRGPEPQITASPFLCSGSPKVLLRFS